MNFLGPLFTLLGNLVGWGRDRDQAKNAADVKAAAVVQDEQSTEDKTRAAIADGNLDEERREAAE